MIPHWWGPRYLTTQIDALDLKPGGKWRFLQYDEKGNEFAFNGIYKEVISPERIVYTFEFEPMPGHIIVSTVLFEDENGKTKLTGHFRLPVKRRSGRHDEVRNGKRRRGIMGSPRRTHRSKGLRLVRKISPGMHCS